MFINLKVLDFESGCYFEKEAILIGDGCAVIHDDGNLSIEPVVLVNGGYETEQNGKAVDLFAKDLSIIDRISEMAAQDFMALCE